ncbi:alcohol dehydrogenase catalytic domain-containing protein [Streptomyces clavifer]|uniref:alcohol dehydrogenase catalytic domain-containing protein n=1 Tax=Streptomyces clavifer TaxID=68188 RepID=UPI00379F3568
MVRGQVYLVPLPVVLGHEGAGVVEAAGSAVQKVQPGDHVATRFLACGRCRPTLDGSSASCANFNAMNFAGRRQDGSHAFTRSDGDAPSDPFFGQSSFAGNATAHESNVLSAVRAARSATGSEPERAPCCGRWRSPPAPASP